MPKLEKIAAGIHSSELSRTHVLASIFGNLLLQTLAQVLNICTLRIFFPLHFILHQSLFWRFKRILNELGRRNATNGSLHINICAKILDQTCVLCKKIHISFLESFTHNQLHAQIHVHQRYDSAISKTGAATVRIRCWLCTVRRV